MKLLRRLVFVIMCVVSLGMTLEKVEGIVAVVDGKVILYSELMQAVQQTKQQSGLAGLSPQEFQQKVLNSLIDEKVLLARASRDSIFVTDDEVRMRVDMHLQRLMQGQNLTMAKLEKAIQAQLGMTLSQYRSQLFQQFHDQILMARIRQMHIGLIQPTRKEVETFFAQYKDSLPLQYNSIHVSHIQLNVEADSMLVDSVRKQADAIIDSMDRGQAWEVMVQRHSQDSLAKKNGDMGFWRKGSLEPNYERAAWRLSIGQYTAKPVKTKYGWHIIRVNDRRDDEIRSSQILLRVIPSVADSAQTLSILQTVRQQVQNGVDFAQLAEKYSQDKETNRQGGSLGWMERQQLDSAYQQVIAALDAGEISEPVLIDDSWHLFRLDQAKPVRALSIEEDYKVIEELASNHQANQKLQQLVERWRKEVYIDIRLKQE